MPFCPQCGAENEPEDRFCGACGYKLHTGGKAAAGKSGRLARGERAVSEDESLLESAEEEAPSALQYSSARSFLLHYMRPIGEGLGVCLVLGLLYIIIGVKLSKVYLPLETIYSPLLMGTERGSNLGGILVWLAIFGVGAAWAARETKENGFLCGGIAGFLAGAIFSLVEDLVFDWATASFQHTLGAAMCGMAIGLLVGLVASLVGSPALVRFPARARQSALIALIGLVGMLIVFVNLPEMEGTRAYVLGNKFQEYGLFNAAILKYDYAHRQDPMDVNILNDWGVALKQVRKPEEAIAVWEQAARWNPSRADIHHNLGIAYHELSRVADAMNQYKLAIASDPEDMIARYNLGIAYVHKGQFDLAEQTFNELLTVDPENTDAKAALEAVAKRRAAAEALESEETSGDSSDEEDQNEEDLNDGEN